ncbi:MAG: serine carboxypeptidase [Anaerolineae bacterium]
MKNILFIHLGEGETTSALSFLGQTVTVKQLGCGGDPARVRACIAEHDGKVDAIALDGMPKQLSLGAVRRPHCIGEMLPHAAQQTPVVDGSGIRGWLEGWGVILADRAQPGIFAEKRILMTPGVNHQNLSQALFRHSSTIRYADPVLYFALPDFPGVGSSQTLDQVAGPTLEQLKDFPFRRLTPQAGAPGAPRAIKPFEWADVLAGDIGAIRRYAPAELKRKTVVVEHATEEDIEDLRQRGVSIVVTLMPPLEKDSELGSDSAALLEGLLVALRPNPDLPLNENTYLDLIADLQWKPAIRYLRAEDKGINRFSFVIHPLSVDFIHKHKLFRWTRYLPDEWVEAVAAYMPPMYLSRVTGAVSPTTGQQCEGYLYALGATPRQMMQHGERFTYERLNQAARMSERMGARIMGLGAFTSVVGDAGITVANEADIAITSGNSLTVAATLEAAKRAVILMGHTDLTQGKVMIVGATGSIASVCSRLLAQAIYDVVLVSIEPEKLIELKRRIQAETPGARVTIATRADDLLGECDLIVTATSAFGQRVIDITKCKPGAVICDVARPPDINQAEAALRPDVLVIESGEVLIPGEIDFGYDIGLPPKTSYACLAETCLLAMEGRFEDYTLGRNIEMERVKEIFKLFQKHGFKLAGLRSPFGEYLTDQDVAKKRELAEKLRGDPELFDRVQRETAEQLTRIPPRAKGVGSDKKDPKKMAWTVGLASAGLVGLLLVWPRKK